MAGNILIRYVWLVDTINRAGRITLSEINQKWQRTDWSEGNELPRRTFHNYRSKIEELFDINIECDNFNRYYIETGLDDDLRIWLLNTFTVSNLVHESHSLKERILLEEIQPRYHLFGHIHGAYGTERIDNTAYVNASILNEQYLLANKPIMLEL